MKCALFVLIFILSLYQYSADRVKRQIRGYHFPGPRREVKPITNTEYSNDQYPNRYSEKPQYEEDDQDQTPRPAVRPATRQAASYRPETLNEYANHNYRPSQVYPAVNAYERPVSSELISRPKVESYGQNGVNDIYAKEKTKEEKEEEEEEQTPTKLEILLASSKFTCASKKDGYYADESVNCQVFHYCVAGVKHSWMCPENTVFHQVHLNCVPASQDICSQSEKFYIVNDYLHKLIDDKGPNNTLRYHQRYYPEEFLGEVISHSQAQSFGGPPVSARRQRPITSQETFNNHPENYPNEERTYVRRQVSRPVSFSANQDSYQPQSMPHNYKQLLQPEKQQNGLIYLSPSSSSGSNYNPILKSAQDSSSYSRSQSSYASNSRNHNYNSGSSSSSYPSSSAFNLYKHSSSSALSPSSNKDSSYESNYFSPSSSSQTNPKTSSSYPIYPPYLSAYTNPDSFRPAERRLGRITYKKLKPISLKPVDLSRETYEEDF